MLKGLESIIYPVEVVKNKEDVYQVIRPDTGAILSTVSDRYTIVHNKDVFLPFVGKFGEDSVKKLLCKKDRFYVEFETGREMDFGGGDLVKERIVVQNSYNRFQTFSCMAGAFRMVCTNGLYSGTAVINYKKRHIGIMPITEIVNNILNNYDQNGFLLWKKMADVKVSLNDQIEMVRNLNCIDVKHGDTETVGYGNNAVNIRIREYSMEYLKKRDTVDNQRTVWGLYNQINRSIALELKSKTNLDRKIKANLNAEKYLINQFNLN